MHKLRSIYIGSLLRFLTYVENLMKLIGGLFSSDVWTYDYTSEI